MLIRLASNTRLSLGRCAFAAAAALVLVITVAACGGKSGSQATTTRVTTTAKPEPLPFNAEFFAPNHAPIVSKPWRIKVTVVDRQGEPVKATVMIQFLFGGIVVGKDNNGRVNHFTGTYREIITYPPAAIGQQLTLQAVVRAKGKTARLNWPLKVKR